MTRLTGLCPEELSVWILQGAGVPSPALVVAPVGAGPQPLPRWIVNVMASFVKIGWQPAGKTIVGLTKK